MNLSNDILVVDITSFFCENSVHVTSNGRPFMSAMSYSERNPLNAVNLITTFSLVSLFIILTGIFRPLSGRDHAGK